MPSIRSFQVGMRYSNEDIFRTLGVGNTGGVRVKRAKNGDVERIVLFTSVPSAKSFAENPYHDRIEGETLVYTGAGKTGNQQTVGVNARILQQRHRSFPIWAFQSRASRRDKSGDTARWEFLGILQLLRSRMETQVDVRREVRLVCVFEFLIHQTVTEVPIVLNEDETAAMFSAVDELEANEATNFIETDHVTAIADAVAIEDVRRRLLLQEPRQFEVTVSELLRKTGFQDVELTRYSQDGGVDVNARPNQLAWPMKHVLIQVQAKRWLHTVGRREIAELRGSIQPAAVGCIVTTSRFSQAASLEAASAGKAPITLVNGTEFASLVLRHGVTI